MGDIENELFWGSERNPRWPLGMEGPYQEYVFCVVGASLKQFQGLWLIKCQKGAGIYGVYVKCRGDEAMASGPKNSDGAKFMRT